MAKNTLTFDDALKRFKSSTKSSMTYARSCAELALEHFQEHGDVSQLQRFHDAMPENYLRKAAFLKWAGDHSPLTRENGQLVKDKSENANAFNVEKAKNAPFWEYAPDKEQHVFDSEEVVETLVKAVKRFENSERYTAKDAAATAKVAAAKAAIETLKRGGSNIPNSEAKRSVA